MGRSSATHPLVAALGSNLGDRLGHLCFGLRALAQAGIDLSVRSSVFETPAIGDTGRPAFLNLVASGSTDLPPATVLSIFKGVEKDAGRTLGPRNAPRPLDLDILFFHRWIIREDGLRVPHPRWKERTFVVQPLLEVLPDLRDPETGMLVGDIAERWPMEPAEIRLVLSPKDFEKECEE
ncbi:MAG: 2-amino-4-hydroxy-6-hydroxymethyldihydropteridine diphosphokinase [Gemmatimonadetes bacterium]|nr:2-amino-4-hydroxy-6-hydroxymethyldihydropteridine diphosphokinase [Gemmatimonadota bacterium]NNM07072.1 2-amino-4-hydroxy-6-hydroxymethyldihydropteridine diphosphokinase [Gemmatimonadota bacterium]